MRREILLQQRYKAFNINWNHQSWNRSTEETKKAHHRVGDDVCRRTETSNTQRDPKSWSKAPKIDHQPCQSTREIYILSLQHTLTFRLYCPSRRIVADRLRTASRLYKACNWSFSRNGWSFSTPFKSIGNWRSEKQEKENNIKWLIA